MKRLICILIALAAVFCLYSCAGSETPTEVSELTGAPETTEATQAQSEPIATEETEPTASTEPTESTEPAVDVPVYDPEAGYLLATYDGGAIYEKDVEDWQNYFMTQNIAKIYAVLTDGTERTQSEMLAIVDEMTNEALDNTTEYVVVMRMLRRYFNETGVALITDEAVNAYAATLKAQIESNYAAFGGYEYWKNTVCGGVSDDFLTEYAEFDIIARYLENCVMAAYPVTDEMVTEYWQIYQKNYLVLPSYTFDCIIVPVDNASLGDEHAWNEAKVEAQGYIDRIRAGEDFDTVKAAAIENSKDYTISFYYSTANTISASDMEGFDDFDARYAEVEEFVRTFEAEGINLVMYADPNGDPSEYTFWFEYLQLTNQLYVQNALTKLEVGETLSEPILYLSGYQIIKLVNHAESAYFRNPTKDKDVYDEIYAILYDEMWDGGAGSSAEKFYDDIFEKYGVVIRYSYAG